MNLLWDDFTVLLCKPKDMYCLVALHGYVAIYMWSEVEHVTSRAGDIHKLELCQKTNRSGRLTCNKSHGQCGSPRAADQQVYTAVF